MDHVTAKRIIHFFEWMLYIGGFLLVILSVFFMSFQDALPRIFPQYPVLAKLSGSFGAITSVMLLIWGAASFWIGHGFHHHRNDTRVAFILISLVLFLGAIVGAYSTATQFWIIGALAIAQVWLFTFQREIVILFKPYDAPKPKASTHKRGA